MEINELNFNFNVYATEEKGVNNQQTTAPSIFGYGSTEATGNRSVPMTKEQIIESLAKEDHHFIFDVLATEPDSSKTQVEKDDNIRQTVTKYYDKKGNFLYSVAELEGSKTKIYNAPATDNGHVRYIDENGDGKFDRMTYTDSNGIPQYEAQGWCKYGFKKANATWGEALNEFRIKYTYNPETDEVQIK